MMMVEENLTKVIVILGLDPRIQGDKLRSVISTLDPRVKREGDGIIEL